MKLTIALANYNRAFFLDRSIKLIAKQSLPPEVFELTIVDDGSTDESDAVIRHHKAHNVVKNFHYAKRIKPRTRYGNCAFARNIGAKIGTGELILFSDPEVMPMPDWAEQHCKTLSDNPITSPDTGKFRLEDPVVASWDKPTASDPRWTVGMCLATRENHVIEGQFIRPGLGNVFADYDWLDMPTTWKRLHKAIATVQRTFNLTDRQIWDEFFFHRFSCGGVSMSRALFESVRGFEEDYAKPEKGLDVWSGEEVVLIHTLTNKGAKWIEEPSCRSVHLHHSISTDGGKGNAYGQMYCQENPKLDQSNAGRDWGLIKENGYEQIF